MGAAFTSCSKGEELFDSGAVVAKQKSEYENNFIKKYGPIDLNQTWDFATMEPISDLPSTSYAGTRGGTRGEGVSVTQESTGTMSIEKKVINWMLGNMQAGVNNTKKGSPFYLRTQEQTFTIVPFYQGLANYYWELWMNVGGEKVKIWSKNTTLQYKTEDGNWHEPTTKGIPSTAVEVSAPTYTYKATPGQNLYFYLQVWKGGVKDDSDPMTLKSLDKYMLALEGAIKPAKVPADNEVIIIGCEDNPQEGTDNDFEDLVFLIYGKPTPPIIPVDEIEITETKRYMMEDLGTTDDFDFNDVVVDVQKVYTQKIHMKPTANDGWEEDYREEKIYKGERAIVRATGGIYDFTLTIGNTIWSKSDKLATGEMLNTGWGNTHIYRTGMQSELAKFPVEGWKPEENNVSVTVVGQGGSNDVKTIKFPKKGEAPMMIAVDPETDWMSERQSVPGPNDPNPWWHY